RRRGRSFGVLGVVFIDTVQAGTTSGGILIVLVRFIVLLLLIGGNLSLQLELDLLTNNPDDFPWLVRGCMQGDLRLVGILGDINEPFVDDVVLVEIIGLHISYGRNSSSILGDYPSDFALAPGRTG